jgi:HAD superfamily hydrolase (TIGR01509 family)
VIEAVVFDLDGVLIDSEPVWEQVRRSLVAEYGGHWAPEAQSRLMGMSTHEWAQYLVELGVGLPPEQVADIVIDRMVERYADELPLLPGTLGAVPRLAGRWPLGLASSSPRRLIDAVLARSGLAALFSTTVSTEEVARGKPAPDVYLAVIERLGAHPAACVAVEDSTNGLKSALAAGLIAIAIPRQRYPVDGTMLQQAARVLPSLDELTADLVESIPSAAHPDGG